MQEKNTLHKWINKSYLKWEAPTKVSLPFTLCYSEYGYISRQKCMFLEEVLLEHNLNTWPGLFLCDIHDLKYIKTQKTAKRVS